MLPAPRLAIDGCPEVSETITLRVDDAVVGSTAFLLMGLAEGSFALAGGCDVLLGSILPLVLPLPIGPTGSAAWSTPLPPSTTGATVFLQAVQATTPITTSNGIELRVR